MDEAAVDTAYRRVSDVSDVVDALIERVVQRHSSALDSFVARVEKYLDEKDEVEDFELQRLVLRFPVLLYNLSPGITRASLESEVAKAAYDRIKSEYLLNAEGKTSADRQAHASLFAESENLAAIATKHIHARLKSKMESAQALYEGVKKIMTARDTEKQVFRFTKEAQGK